MSQSVEEHRFLKRPHRTVLALALPTFFSMIAEPLTGLADTIFVAWLGATELAALGLGAILLSSIFWVFNFLNVTTQTEIARADGAGRREEAREIASTALSLAALVGLVMGTLGLLLSPWLVKLMGGSGELADLADTYLRIRFLGSPAILLTAVTAAALRGLQEVKVPMLIATGVNVGNLILDPLLIFGFGDFAGWGVAGAAWASVAAQLVGGILSVVILIRRLGWCRPRARHLGGLVRVGKDVFLRTGLLSTFLALATRSATLQGDAVAAAHQVVRQSWLTCAFALDSLAIAAQSLVGYFLGGGRVDLARRSAAVALGWGLVTGLVLSLGSVLGRGLVETHFVPEVARAAFVPAWWIFCLGHPINAVTFVTDGIHFGTRDYRFLRNTMVVATATGWLGLVVLARGESALTAIWIITLAWTSIRALSATLRIWPGFGAAPLRPARTE